MFLVKTKGKEKKKKKKKTQKKAALESLDLDGRKRKGNS
jgi:hypothetical protein